MRGNIFVTITSWTQHNCSSPDSLFCLTNNHYSHKNLTTNDGLWNRKLLGFIRGRKHNKILSLFHNDHVTFTKWAVVLFCDLIARVAANNFCVLMTIANLTSIVIKHDKIINISIYLFHDKAMIKKLSSFLIGSVCWAMENPFPFREQIKCKIFLHSYIAVLVQVPAIKKCFTKSKSLFWLVCIRVKNNFLLPILQDTLWWG